MNKIPESLANLRAAWNERDPARLEQLLNKAVSSDVEFVDPNYAVTGVAAFRRMMLEFQARFPQATCLLTSAIDVHHDRARYHWRVVIDKSNFVDGMDAVQFAPSGLVRRVDGFFGVLKIETPR